jgi:hypothetical protein
MATYGGDDVTEPVIEVLDASVSYMIRHGASPTLKETVIQAFKRESHDVEIQALQNQWRWKINVIEISRPSASTNHRSRHCARQRLSHD